MTKFRLYIDESGNSNYPKSSNPPAGQQYLSLTGIAISDISAQNDLRPRIEKLKTTLTGDIDNDFSLHRDEAMNRSNEFSALHDPSIEESWNDQIIDLLSKLDYIIFTTVIDKVNHMSAYREPNHPYYYCLNLMLERYAKFLHSTGGVGDVMIESRGEREDIALKDQYSRIFNYGTDFYAPSYFSSVFTSKDIKVKGKASHIPGLELADLLAVASKLDVLLTYGKIDHIASKFNQKIIGTIQSKYYCGERGVIGNGKKLIFKNPPWQGTISC